MSWEELRAPFPAADIEWRVGSTTQDKSRGLALAYITARAVMDRLDAVVGPAGWTDSYRPVDRAGSKGWVCRLEVRVDEEWTAHEDGADETSIEATKGGLSDALKRAAVKFGIGRYLYHLPAQWFPLEPQGRGHGLKGTPSLPEWALPGGSGHPPGGAAPVSAPVSAPAPLMRPDLVAAELRTPAQERMATIAKDPFSGGKRSWSETLPERGPLRVVWEKAHPGAAPPWYWAIEGSKGGGRDQKLRWAAKRLEEYALDPSNEEKLRERAWLLMARAEYCCAIYAEDDSEGPLDTPSEAESEAESAPE